MENINLATDNTLLVRLFELRIASYMDGSCSDIEPWDNLACDLFKALDTLRTAYAKSLENKQERQQKLEPFGYISQRCLELIRDDKYVGDTWPISAIPREVHANLRLNIPLYTASVLPAVPEEIKPEDVPDKLPTANLGEYECCVGADMWNACRAAMLAAYPQREEGDA